MTQHRIVSLIPSATEIVAALGYEQSLVGRSHECDFPTGVKQLKVCTEPRIDLSGTSRQIDTAVLEAVRDALSVYRVFGSGPRVVESCEILAEILRPDQTNSLHRGIGWQPLSFG